MKKLAFIFLFLSFVTGNAWAGVFVAATLSDNTVSIEEETTIIISVTGSSNSDEPVTPRVAGLNIVKTGKSSQIQIINGALSTSAEHIYTVVPEEEGEYTIPPFTVLADGVEYKSPALRLNVTRGHSYSTTPKSADPQGSTPEQYQKYSGQDTSKFWIETSVNNAFPYVSEQILFTFKLYAAMGVQTHDFKLPDFGDFWFEEVVPERKGNEVINGRQYATFEKVYALFPLKSGKITIGETSLKIQYQEKTQNKYSGAFDPFNDPFFNRGQVKQGVLHADAIDIEVKPLPQPVPADFTNLIGDFGVQVSLSNDEVQQGDTLTYEIVFSGVGNIKDGQLPDLAFDGFKVYMDKPVVEVQKSSKILSGKKIFKAALVPTESGDTRIPSFNVSFFNPQKGEYVQIGIDEQMVQVLPSTQEQTNALLTNGHSQNGQKNVVYQDIAPIIAIVSLAFRESSKLNPVIFYFGVFGLPLVLAGIIFVRFLLKATAVGTKKMSLKKSSYQKLMNRLEDSHTDADSILESVRKYLSVMFDVQGQALTASEIKNLCLEKNISPDLAGRMERVLENLEAAQYGFNKQSSLAGQRKELKALINEID